MRRRSMKAGSATGLLLLVGSILAAHDTWILPTSMRVPPGTTVRLDMTSGMEFPAPEAAVKPDRLARAFFRLAGTLVEVSHRRAADKALELELTPQKAGVATVWAESKPRTLELTAAEVKEYLDEIGAPETVRKDWKTAPEPRRWRETYTKHAKTFLRVGDAKGDRSWSAPAGMELEIVPEGDPTSLEPGDVFPVRVLFHGGPLPGLSVGLLAAGERTPQVRTTDGAGRVSFRIARPGWWLLRATRLVRSATSRDEWTSQFATLTVKAGGR